MRSHCTVATATTSDRSLKTGSSLTGFRIAMHFRDWILETFTPVVMIVPSPEAESLVSQHNGLTIVDMLRPYGYFHHLSGMSSICIRMSNDPLS